MKIELPLIAARALNMRNSNTMFGLPELQSISKTKP